MYLEHNYRGQILCIHICLIVENKEIEPSSKKTSLQAMGLIWIHKKKQRQPRSISKHNKTTTQKTEKKNYHQKKTENQGIEKTKLGNISNKMLVRKQSLQR